MHTQPDYPFLSGRPKSLLRKNGKISIITGAVRRTIHLTTCLS